MTLPESGLNGTNELISGFGVSVLRTENDPQLSYIIEDGKVLQPISTRVCCNLSLAPWIPMAATGTITLRQ